MAGGFFQELKRRNVFRVALVYGVASWLLMQIADVMFPALVLPEWTIRLLAALLILGLPIALIFAWAFEMTADGIRLEKHVDREASITPVTGRKLDFMIIGLLAAALAVAVGLHFVDEDDTATSPDAAQVEIDEPSELALQTSDQSIAVLPFINMSADPDNEYFSDGISEELLNLLVKVDGLTVASRTSSFRFKDKDVDIPTMADQLNVRHILEGSVRKSGVKVRVTAQLIDAETDKHLWSDSYDRELNDIFAIQDEIANMIVDSLKQTLGGSGGIGLVAMQQPTESIEAYENYLQGMHIWRLRGIDNIKRSIELFEKAVELDPQFARAWSALATAQILVPVYASVTAAEWDEWTTIAETTAKKAAALDPTLAEPHTTLAAVYESRGASYAALAEQQFLEAIRINPKSELAYQWYGEFLAVPGRLQECLENLQKAYELDPASPVINNSLSYAYYLNRSHEKALEHAIKSTDLGIEKNSNDGMIALAYFSAGRIEEAQAVFENTADDSAEKLAIMAVTNPSLKGQAIEAVRNIDGAAADIMPSAMMIWIGDKDAVFEDMLARAKLERLWPGELWHPQVMEWADDPRFKEIIDIIDMHRYWKDVAWADHCEPDGDSFRCGSDINKQ